MKKFFLSMMLSMTTVLSISAMSFERAQSEALYLTDKMAYELNLNEQQYNDAYEINLDYFLRVDSPSDLYGSYYDYRLYDLRCILHDWQYRIFAAADYFLRPIVWRATGWYFPIYSYYNRGYYYYSRPGVYISYRGGHSRAYYSRGFYAERRPHWDGGLRGRDMTRPAVRSSHTNPGRGLRGNGYRVDGNNRRGGSGNYNPGAGHSGSSRQSYGSDRGGSSSHSGSTSHGNSFDGSSSRMGGGSHVSGGSHSNPGSGSSRGGGNIGSSRSSSPSMGGSSRGSGGGQGSSSRGGGGSSRGGRR